MGLLPTKKTEPVLTLANTTIHIYGPGKIGKSTFCSKAPTPLFIATEQTLDGLSVYPVFVTTWNDPKDPEHSFLHVCAEIEKGEHDFQTIIIDTMDGLYRLCADYINLKHGFRHEGDAGYGLGYSLIKAELERILKRLSFLPYGLILVSHVDEKEVDTRTGKKRRMGPPYPRKTMDMLDWITYFALFCDYETETGEDGQPITKHVIRTKPHPNYYAGDRFNILPETMLLEWSAFIEAFEKGAKRLTGQDAQPKAAAEKKEDEAQQAKPVPESVDKKIEPQQTALAAQAKPVAKGSHASAFTTNKPVNKDPK